MNSFFSCNFLKTKLYFLLTGEKKQHKKKRKKRKENLGWQKMRKKTSTSIVLRLKVKHFFSAREQNCLMVFLIDLALKPRKRKSFSFLWSASSSTWRKMKKKTRSGRGEFSFAIRCLCVVCVYMFIVFSDDVKKSEENLRRFLRLSFFRWPLKIFD